MLWAVHLQATPIHVLVSVAAARRLEHRHTDLLTAWASGRLVRPIACVSRGLDRVLELLCQVGSHMPAQCGFACRKTDTIAFAVQRMTWTREGVRFEVGLQLGCVGAPTTHPLSAGFRWQLMPAVIATSNIA